MAARLVVRPAARPGLWLLGAVVLGASLAGCSASASIGGKEVTVGADKLADTVATSLQESIGAADPPTIDCGTGDIKIEADQVLHCDLSVAGDDAVYDVTVTVTEVNTDTGNFSISSQVADQPK